MYTASFHIQTFKAKLDAMQEHQAADQLQIEAGQLPWDAQYALQYALALAVLHVNAYMRATAVTIMDNQSLQCICAT